MSLDRGLFELVHSFTGNGFIDSMMVLFAEYLVLVVPAVLVYLWFKGREGKNDSVLTFGATITGISVAYGMGLLYFHQNPSTVYDTIVAAKPENAFPSQHTAAVFSAAWPLFLRERRNLGYLTLISAALTGFARVYIGEHWPVDVLGAIVASLAAIIFVYVFSDEVDLLEPVYSFSETIESRVKNVLA